MLNEYKIKHDQIKNFRTAYVELLYYKLPKHFAGRHRTYNNAQLWIILTKEAEITLKNKDSVKLRENNYLLISANTKIHIEIEMETKVLVFELSDHLIEDVFSKVDLDEIIFKGRIEDKDYHIGNNKWNIYDDIVKIFTTHQSNIKNSRFLIDLYIQKIVFDLIQDKSTHNILKSDRDNPINMAIRYINNNIHTAINIGDLAEELYMSESNFSHLFKKSVGMTAGEYIKDKKLELASHYLKTDNVTNVAYNLGYKNISYFIKIFKEKYKHTPKQYKMLHYQIGMGGR